MGGLGDVLADVARKHDGAFCICGELTTDPEGHLGSEQEAVVLAWLNDLLSGDEMRDQVARAINAQVWGEGDERPSDDDWTPEARAALDVVKAMVKATTKGDAK